MKLTTKEELAVIAERLRQHSKTITNERAIALLEAASNLVQSAKHWCD